MKPILDQFIRALKDRFGDVVQGVSEFRDDVVVTVEKHRIEDISWFLRDNPDCPFPLCEDVFGIDQYRSKDRFEVNYHFFSVREKVRIRLKVIVDEKDLVVPTITEVYPGANWYERETYDMYGVIFTDHPDLRRIYMPEEYEYFPLRKDFPLMGIPGSIPLPKK